MKFTIHAGAEMETLTQGELSEELTAALSAWRAELGRGAKWRKFSARADVAAGVWTIGGASAPNNDKYATGPQPGFTWAVTRVAVAGNGVIAGTDLWSVYVDDVTPSRLVTSGHTRFQTYDVGVLVLNGGEQLTLNGVGTGAGTDVTVSGQAVEIPEQLAWMLL